MLKGTIELKGDKSISHRVLIIAAICKGESTIKNLSICNDVKTTINILRQCNVDIQNKSDKHIIVSNKIHSNDTNFNCENSGTTARLMLGFLPSQGIAGTLYGDKSLSSRPMNRIISPLKEMGIKFINESNNLPIQFMASTPKGINHILTIPSAQVKTSLILCKLACKNKSKIKDPYKSRDHTERLLSYLGFNSNYYFKKNISGFKYTVPGDISNAAFIISAAILIKNSNIIIKNTLYNKTRFGYINALIKMGANIKINNIKNKYNEQTCDISAKYTNKLKGINISSEDITSMIDEVPVFALVACYASGETIVRGAKELKYKESNRIHSIVNSLKDMKIDIEELNNGFKICGSHKLYYTNTFDFNDHRIALIHEIAKLVTGNTIKGEREIINTSFPEFYKIINQINE